GGDRRRRGLLLLGACELHHRHCAARGRRAHAEHLTIMAPKPTPAPSPVAPGVAFEVERFEWTSADRLELVGRWSGLRGHRFLRPTLDVEVDGERRRMLADLEHKPWAPEDGQDWIAAFTWRGDPGDFDEAELTVSPELAVQLPAPGGSAPKGVSKAAAPAGERRPARRPR